MSGKYHTIVADPAWRYASPGGHLRASSEARPKSWDTRAVVDSGSRYGSMSVEEICSLQPPGAEDAHLYLWTTNAFIEDAHAVARAWGFRPITVLTWVKVHADDRSKVSMRSGHYFRGASEHVVFAVKGSLPLQTDEALPTAFLWPRLPHSVKPDAFLDLVEKASPGPYLEMFARRARFGWDYYGDQSLETAQMPEAAA